MALAVASTSTASANNVLTLDIPAPSGIATGDLLLIVASGKERVTGIPSGFTELVSVESTGTVTRGDTSLSLSYKIAVLADESATDYTITFANSDGGGAGVMFRVTGWTSGNPLYASHIGQGQYGSSHSNPILISRSTTISRPDQQLLIMANGIGTDDNTISWGTANYSITSGDANPTWTEVTDVVYSTNNSSNTASKNFAVAYAVTTDTSDITGYSFEMTDGSSDSVEHIQGLFCFVQPRNDTGTAVRTSLGVSEYDPMAQADAIGTTSRLGATTSTAPAASQPDNTSTVWSNTDKPNTTWIKS